jgi:two-component system sensor histidine kinase ChvG
LNDVLDRTAEIEAQNAEAKRRGEEVVRPAPKRFAAIRRPLRSAWQFFVSQSFSSLTRRIVFLNLTGLVALVTGVLYLSQFRAGLIDARVQSLLVQSEIIAGAIAASATVESDGNPVSNFPSIPNGWRRCYAGWCRRPRRARASTTATAC